jgi:hypothetical protein
MTLNRDTICFNCHQPFGDHYDYSCPNHVGLYKYGPRKFKALECEELPIHEAVEAVDAPEEHFDVYYAWQIHRYGIMFIAMLAVAISVLGGVYIGHFMWH